MTQTYLRSNSDAGFTSDAAADAGAIDASLVEELAVFDLLKSGMTDEAVYVCLNGNCNFGHRHVSRQWMDSLIERVRSAYDFEDQIEAYETGEDEDGEAETACDGLEDFS